LTAVRGGNLPGNPGSDPAGAPGSDLGSAPASDPLRAPGYPAPPPRHIRQAAASARARHPGRGRSLRTGIAP